MNKNEEYILHCSGFSKFLDWMETQSSYGMPCNVSGQIIYAHPMASKFFSLGVSKNKSIAKLPFLAVQPIEAHWIKMIQWEKICVRKRDMHIYLISKFIPGDNENYPDIPSFGFALSFDTIEKLNLLFQIKTLDAREYRQEDGEVYINFHTKLFSLPLSHLENNAPILNDSQKVTSYLDLMSQKETELVNHFGDTKLEIQGETTYSPEAEALMKDMDKREGFAKQIFKDITASINPFRKKQ